MTTRDEPDGADAGAGVPGHEAPLCEAGTAGIDPGRTRQRLIDFFAAPRGEYALTRWIFLRALGVVNLIAFISLWVQIEGLVGSQGVSPAAQFLKEAQHQLHGGAWTALPTLCWLDCSDPMLDSLCLTGTLASVLLIFDVLPLGMLATCWVSYLSLCGVGQQFLSFQWDILLLETDFASLFLAPLIFLPRSPRRAPAPSLASIWLLRWILFRLMLESGLVKLMSGDPTWRGLTALQYHYETQPLPTPLAWYAFQLPAWFQSLSCLVMFGIELGAPWLILAPRRFRLWALPPLVGLQILIALTGNYGFFNLLTIVLCLGAIPDDAAWPRWIRRVLGEADPPGLPAGMRWPAWIMGPVFTLLVFLGLPFDNPVKSALEPFRLANSYGLFAVMTTERPEIVLEGSDDGNTWKPYTFLYKPGDLSRPPPVVEPYMPRLDWQMWFAALGTPRQNPWIGGLCLGLLQGRPAVLGLLGPSPFPRGPPRYLRATLYEYRFTRRKAEGRWWERVELEQYLPTLYLHKHP